MHYLILTILCTSTLFTLFRIFSKIHIDLFQSIVWNYVVCCILGFIIQHDQLTEALYNKHMSIVIASSLLGSCYLPGFFLIGTSTQRAGLTRTITADKLSMVIPASFAIAVGVAPFSWLQVLAFGMGIIAIYLITQKDVSETLIPTKSFYRFLPICVFLCSGLLDLTILFINKTFGSAESGGLFTLHTFLAAAFWGILSFSVLLTMKKITFQAKAMLAGIALGIPNYFSIHNLLKTLNYFHHNGSFVFPMMNISIILLITVISYFFFKDRFTKKLVIGLGLATSAILILYFNNL
jgi:hypothetical protein